MQVCAMSPMTMSLWMPCFLSCKSKSVLAKPLEHQCSWTTISPGSGANAARNSPPHVPYSNVFRNVRPGLIVAWAVSMMHCKENQQLRLPSGIEDLLHMGNAVVRFGNSFDARPDLAALGNEVVVRID